MVDPPRIESRLDELERQVEIFKKLFKTIQDYILNHNEITDFDTKLFDSLHEEKRILEERINKQEETVKKLLGVEIE